MTERKNESRYWELTTLEKNATTGEYYLTKEKIDEVVDSHISIKEYAYILHDKDVYTEEDVKNGKCSAKDLGKLKPAHFHIVMKFTRSQDVKPLAKWFGIPESFFQKKTGRGAFYDSIKYLVHASKKEKSKGKHEYSADEVTCLLDDYDSFQEFLDDYNSSHYKSKSISKEKLRLEVLSGKTLNEIKRENPAEYVKDMDGLKKCRNEYLKEAKLPPYRLNFYISGSGGSGKGLLSEALARVLVDPEGKMNDDELFCYVGSDSSVSFENYDGQPVIIWDDCRHNELFDKLGNRGAIFNVFDTKPKRIPQKKKYGQANIINFINIVNSVEPVDDFLNGLAGRYKDKSSGEYVDAEDSQKAQSYRRFPICIKIHSDYYDIQTYNPFFGSKEGSYHFEIHKYNYAPFIDAVNMFGSDSEEYRKFCCEALKPVVDLFKKAEKILCHEHSCDTEDFEKIISEVGKSTRFQEFVEKYYDAFCNFANKYINNSDSRCNVDSLVSEFCKKHSIVDGAMMNIIKCEIEERIRFQGKSVQK